MPIKDILLDWRLHLSVLVITVIAELIGVIAVPIGIGSILLLPLLYAFVLGLLINPNVIPGARALIRDREVHAASPLIVIAIMPFIAKFGTIIGPSMEQIIAAGPALILQELGNLGTIVLAFPVAVLVLRSDTVEHDHFTSPLGLPYIGAISCAFFVGPWTGRDSVQYLIAAVLIGLGVVLWGATVFYMKSKGQDPLASDMDKLSE